MYIGTMTKQQRAVHRTSPNRTLNGLSPRSTLKLLIRSKILEMWLFYIVSSWKIPNNPRSQMHFHHFPHLAVKNPASGKPHVDARVAHSQIHIQPWERKIPASWSMLRNQCGKCIHKKNTKYQLQSKRKKHGKRLVSFWVHNGMHSPKVGMIPETIVNTFTSQEFAFLTGHWKATKYLGVWACP